MTIDHHLFLPDKYESIINSSVVLLIEEIYVQASDVNGIANILELNALVFADVYSDLKIQLIDEAIERKDYELYGLDEQDFVIKAYRGEIGDIAVEPYLNENTLLESIEGYLRAHQLVIDYNGYILHSPLQEVW